MVIIITSAPELLSAWKLPLWPFLFLHLEAAVSVIGSLLNVSTNVSFLYFKIERRQIACVPWYIQDFIFNSSHTLHLFEAFRGFLTYRENGWESILCLDHTFLHQNSKGHLSIVPSVFKASHNLLSFPFLPGAGYDAFPSRKVFM